MQFIQQWVKTARISLSELDVKTVSGFKLQFYYVVYILYLPLKCLNRVLFGS